MPKKELIGTVVSDKMSKTIVVEIRTKTTHPKYNKLFYKTKKFFAHDELEQAHTGDRVRIIEYRPMSLKKRWILQEILQKSESI